MKETHPFEAYIPSGATKLIIGTIPPERFSQKKLFCDDVEFYYGSRDNAFWELLQQVVDNQSNFLKINNEDEVDKRKVFLEKHRIGVCDIIKKTNRKNSSSLDKDLTDYEYLDIVNILQNNPSIHTLIYTSAEGGVKSFMTKYLKEKFQKEVCHKTIDKTARRFQLKLENTPQNIYEVSILYSPAPTALKGIGENGSLKRLNQWKEIFL